MAFKDLVYYVDSFWSRLGFPPALDRTPEHLSKQIDTVLTAYGEIRGEWQDKIACQTDIPSYWLSASDVLRNAHLEPTPVNIARLKGLSVMLLGNPERLPLSLDDEEFSASRLVKFGRKEGHAYSTYFFSPKYVGALMEALGIGSQKPNDGQERIITKQMATLIYGNDKKAACTKIRNGALALNAECPGTAGYYRQPMGGQGDGKLTLYILKSAKGALQRSLNAAPIMPAGTRVDHLSVNQIMGKFSFPASKDHSYRQVIEKKIEKLLRDPDKELSAFLAPGTALDHDIASKPISDFAGYFRKSRTTDYFVSPLLIDLGLLDREELFRQEKRLRPAERNGVRILSGDVQKQHASAYAVLHYYKLDKTTPVKLAKRLAVIREMLEEMSQCDHFLLGDDKMIGKEAVFRGSPQGHAEDWFCNRKLLDTEYLNSPKLEKLISSVDKIRRL